VDKVKLERDFPNRRSVLLAVLCLLFVSGAQAAEESPGTLRAPVTLPVRTGEALDVPCDNGVSGELSEEDSDPSIGASGDFSTPSPQPTPTPETTPVPEPIPEVPTPAPVITPVHATYHTPDAVPVIVPVTPSVSPSASPQPSVEVRPVPESSTPPIPPPPHSPSWAGKLVLLVFILLCALWLGAVPWRRRAATTRKDFEFLGLDKLGIPDAMREEFVRVIHSRSGLILATGPARSGKTSTLYSALSQIVHAPGRHITTLEDPVEYELAGTTQIHVNKQVGITYESGLKSLLRQNPDVIFVGEIRNFAATKIVLRAAASGHLLFGSLRTKDAASTILRLQKMGFRLEELSSALLLVIAQRLVRVLCPSCREAFSSTGRELRAIGVELTPGETLYRAKGCPTCKRTGYVGRTGIFEMLVFDEEIRQAVDDGLQVAALTELAKSKGFRECHQDGVQKIRDGITTAEEVLRAMR